MEGMNSKLHRVGAGSLGLSMRTLGDEHGERCSLLLIGKAETQFDAEASMRRSSQVGFASWRFEYCCSI